MKTSDEEQKKLVILGLEKSSQLILDAISSSENSEDMNKNLFVLEIMAFNILGHHAANCIVNNNRTLESYLERACEMIKSESDIVVKNIKDGQTQHLGPGGNRV